MFVRRTSSEFTIFLCFCHTQICHWSNKTCSYLQRVVRYPLLLRTILKLLDSSSEEYNCLLGKESYVSPQQPIRWGLLIWLDADKDFNRISHFQRLWLQLKKLLSTLTRCRGLQSSSHRFFINWLKSLEYSR